MTSTPESPSRESVLEDLPFHPARTGIALRRFNDRTLDGVGLTPQAPGLASVLHALEELDDCSVNRLVKRTHLPNVTLTGLLDTLEHDGCIARVRDPEDGRSRRIRLTKAGRQLYAKLQQRDHRVMGMFRKTPADAKTAELMRLFAQVAARKRTCRTGAGSVP